MSIKITYICDLCRREFTKNPAFREDERLAQVTLNIPTGIPGGQWCFDACLPCREILSNQVRLALNTLTIGDYGAAARVEQEAG